MASDEQLFSIWVFYHNSREPSGYFVIDHAANKRFRRSYKGRHRDRRNSTRHSRHRYFNLGTNRGSTRWCPWWTLEIRILSRASGWILQSCFDKQLVRVVLFFECGLLLQQIIALSWNFVFAIKLGWQLVNVTIRWWCFSDCFEENQPNLITVNECFSELSLSVRCLLGADFFIHEIWVFQKRVRHYRPCCCCTRLFMQPPIKISSCEACLQTKLRYRGT